MEQINVELIFNWLDKATEIMQEHLNETYLDSLPAAIELLMDDTLFDNLDKDLASKLSEVEAIKIGAYSPVDIRKAIQLTILKGMKDSTQPNHLMTPEAVALLVGYFAEKLTQDKEELRILDPVCGTGNLLTTVISQLNKQTEAYGSEVDPTLIQIALTSANAQRINIELFQQDSLRPLFIDPVDLVIADLPVGYYPDDLRANEFELKATEGHSYAHHLLIEQSIHYTKDDGYLIFLIPEFLFSSEQSDQLHSFIQKYANIIGVIRLPDSAFKAGKNVKNIFIIQKKGEKEAPKQPLLVNLPSLKNTAGMNDILEQMNEWFRNYQEQYMQ